MAGDDINKTECTINMGLNMKVESVFTIDGVVCFKGITSKGLSVYESANASFAYIVNDKTGEAVFKIDVDPYTGEGGGGSLDFKECK